MTETSVLVVETMRSNESDASTVTTMLEYGGLQTAFDFKNGKLFGGELPDVFIVYSRRSHSGGHYSPRRYSGRGNTLNRPELSLNPDGFVGKSDEWIVSLLVHEMTHHWQDNFGQKRREKYSYHDLEWAEKMESLGLMPSNTGMVDGKRTGVQMSHYIIPGGPFQKAFAELAATGWRLNLESTIVPGASKKPAESKIKFTCPSCGGNAWGKPDSKLVCKVCLLEGLIDLSISKAKAVQLIELIDGRTMQSPKLEGPAP